MSTLKCFLKNRLIISLLAVVLFGATYAQSRGADRGGGGVGILRGNQLQFADLQESNQSHENFTKNRYIQLLDPYSQGLSNQATKVASTKEFFSCALEKFKRFEQIRQYKYPILSHLLENHESIQVLKVQIPLESFISGQIPIVIDSRELKFNQPAFSYISSRFAARAQRPIGVFYQSNLFVGSNTQFGFLLVNSQLYENLDYQSQCAFQIHEALRRISSYQLFEQTQNSSARIFEEEFSTVLVEQLTPLFIEAIGQNNLIDFEKVENVNKILIEKLSSFGKNLVGRKTRSNIDTSLSQYLMSARSRDLRLEIEGQTVLRNEASRRASAILNSLHSGTARIFDPLLLQLD